MPARLVNIDVNGQTHAVAVERTESAGDRFRVSWNGQTLVVDARMVDTHTLSFVETGDGAASHLARFVETSSRGEVDVYLDGAVVRAVVNRPRARFGDGPTDDGEGVQQVVAPMPGKVVRVLVEAGEQVNARQGLVVVEAMKMENELTALRAGRVSEVRVGEGMSVETGKVLVVIE